MNKKVPVYKKSEIEKPSFRPPTSSPTLRWFGRLPESPFEGDYWPVFHDGKWHWIKTPPRLDFRETENS